MNSQIKVLIVEDHPFVIEGYTNVLSELSLALNSEFLIDSATNCDSALLLLENSLRTKFYDLVFLDIRIPASKSKKILCGEDLGMKIREQCEACKIIVSTNYKDNYRLNNVIKNVDPEGFLVKSDATFEIIKEAVEIVLVDPPYYSRSIIKLLRQQMSNELILDAIDRQLLYEISLGTKTKDLPNVLPLSIAGVERRKRRLAREFNANSKDDFNLIQIAKEKGFI